jgi:hypothetical protein
MLDDFGYAVEPTGANSPSQNGGVEIFNGTLAVKVRTLPYGSGLPAKFWSSALLHATYLQNCLVHSVTGITPFEGWYGQQPNLSHLKCFGSRVCVKATGLRQCKLDKHDFTGIFLGYTATDNNIIYLDTTSGVVKTSHHMVFNEAWYLQDSCSPAAQLLYNLGLEADDSDTTHPDYHIPQVTPTVPLNVPWPQPIFPPSRIDIAWPPMPDLKSKLQLHPPRSISLPLLLRLSDTPTPIAARAARVRSPTPSQPPIRKQIAADIVTEFLIGPHDMELIYMSPDPYGRTFEASLDLQKCNLSHHRTAGLRLITKNECLILAAIDPSTPGARIDKWRTQLRSAWLISINDIQVSTLADVHQAILLASSAPQTPCTLLFLHPKVTPDISHRGVPVMTKEDFTQYTHNQLNTRIDLLNDVDPDAPCILRTRCYDIVTSGDLRQYITCVMRLTRGRLLQQDDWMDWQHSEYLQLNQYMDQVCFGDPVAVDKEDAIFHLVWTYNIKALDRCKKARCVCDGSSCSGSVKVLNKVYANCVNQTSSRLFYAVSAAENLLIFGSNVCNAFAKAPPPKQGFFIHPDCAFNDWWVHHKKRPPIPPGHVIPVLSAMQGHPESPRLWEKHADAILRELGLTPTVHEPCLYSGLINNKRVVFMRQVDDFAIAAPDQRTADILLNMLDKKLTMPIKRQGLLDMFNGVDVIQSKHYIKIDCHTYVDKFCAKYLDTWLRKLHISPTDSRPIHYGSGIHGRLQRRANVTLCP